ncbi:LapD/MoxY N-terminal periplasmic domain-containing protein [Bordetella genomosp. 13]|uniref:bifunctional diguanylate cyclase/phosphodiesterase n=1 Tax=Bordetella genomosp. 13 TaxID=463040 RepID=UPI0011A974E7|nr:LapD/MoxY N-terminal periplasmic domain-containing protein [Bordetella genomosp. 13]
MSIFRRLLLSISLVIAAILVGVLALSLSSAREYLSGQLQMQGRDAAVSLALALSQPGSADPAVQALLVSSLFDGGNFREVSFEDAQGKPIVQRRHDQAEQPAVPAWFRTLVPLHAPAVSHAVNNGWRQIGSVTLVADDAYAWETLWSSCLRMMGLVLAAGLLWSLFAWWLARWLRGGVMSELSEHVRTLGRGQWNRAPAVPRVAEMSDVADAVNEAREQLRSTAEAQAARAESMRVELDRDVVTGAASRKAFLQDLESALAESVEDAEARQRYPMGHVLVFRQRDLAGINRHMHRALADQWLRMVYERLHSVVSARRQPGAVLGRLNGSDFALLFPNSTTPVATLLAERLRAELRHLRIPVGEGALCRWALALTNYLPGAQPGDVLARLDHALMQAESLGDDQPQFAPEDAPQGLAMGETAWKEAIQNGVRLSLYSLSVDPLVDLHGQVVRHEAQLTLQANGAQEAIPAHLFIPAAVRLNLSADCDLQAVRLGLDWLAENAGDLTVRLSLPSLKQASFLTQLHKLLSESPPLARRLFVEIDAHGLVEQYATVEDLCRLAARLGTRVGLRRLAQQFSALTRLHGLPLAYVKLGGGFVSGLAKSPGSQALAATVIDLAHQRDIDVCAEDVPDAQTRQALEALGITLMRGPGVVAA